MEGRCGGKIQKYIHVKAKMQKELFELDKWILSADSYYLSNQYNICTVSKTKELEIY